MYVVWWNVILKKNPSVLDLQLLLESRSWYCITFSKLSCIILIRHFSWIHDIQALTDVFKQNIGAGKKSPDHWRSSCYWKANILFQKMMYQILHLLLYFAKKMRGALVMPE